MQERPGGSTVSKNDLQTGEQPHMLRNSPSNCWAGQQCPEFVNFTTKSDQICANAPDSFSGDECGFEFRNGPLRSIWKRIPCRWKNSPADADARQN